MESTPGTQNRRPPGRKGWYRAPLSLLVLGIVSVGLLIWTNSITEKRRAAHTLNDAVEDMRIKVTSAHLWLRRTVSETESVEDEAIVNDLLAAVSLADAMLSGGTTAQGRVLQAVEDPELRPVVEDIRSVAIELQKRALQILRDHEGGLPLSESQVLFDSRYNEFQSKATYLNFVVEDRLEQYIQYSERLYLGTLIIWTSAIALTVIGFWNREFRRKEAEVALQKANEELEERVGRRTEELSALNLKLREEIGERKQTESALRRSEALYRAVIEDQTELICRFHPDGTLTFVNDAYARYFGRKPEELVGTTFFALIPDEEHEWVKKHLSIIGEDVPWASIEHEVLKPGGEVSWMQWTDRAILDEQGRFLEFQSVGRDVTDQKLAEEALRKSESHFRSLIENALDIISVISSRGDIQYCSPSVKRVLGYEPKELLGRNMLDFIHPDDLPRVKETMARHFGNPGNTELTEYRFRGSDGTYSSFEGIGKAIISENGETIIILNSRDTTARELAEEALRQSEASYRSLSLQFHTLLDAIPDSITLLDRDLKVLWANRGTAERTGQDLASLSGQHCYSLWHHLPNACPDCPVNRAFLSGQAESAQIQSPDSRFWDIRAFPIRNEEGAVSSVIGLCNDVTDKLAFEAERMRAAHLASLGELAAGVAHEINNPINGIINYAQLLSDECVARGADCELPRRIMKEGNRIANIVKSLLSFARERKEEKVPVAIWEILADALALTESQIRKDGIILRVDLPEDLPRITAHSQQLQQVLLNLISNARYALNQRYPGRHTDKILEITGRAVRGDGVPMVRLAFRDRGMGIPSALLGKIMLPFFTTKPRGVGTGLGLSISHGIVGDHGGTLAVESEEGLFTSVTVTLPAES